MFFHYPLTEALFARARRFAPPRARCAPSPRTPELEVLGLSSSSSAYGVSVIRRAYRVASRQWHPDQWVGEQAWCRHAAAKALEVVQEAYQTLLMEATEEQLTK